MAKTKIRLDHQGIGRKLGGGEVASIINGLGEAVGSAVNETASGDPIPVDVTPYKAKLRRDTIPRAAVAVTMVHPAARAVEAKRGSLVRAAASVGLEVKAKGGR